MRGEGQSWTQAAPGTQSGRTQPTTLGTELWTRGVPASQGVSLSQCRCFFCLRFHLASVGLMCHRRLWVQDDALNLQPLQIWQTFYEASWYDLMAMAR